MENLTNKRVKIAYIQAMQDMYEVVSTSIQTHDGEMRDFSIIISFHQGSNLSPTFYFNFGCAHVTHPRVRSEMHAFLQMI